MAYARSRPQSAVGRQALSTRNSEPEHKFGSGPSRARLHVGDTHVGPGSYKQQVSMQAQLTSQKPSAPAYHFGKMRRPSTAGAKINPTGPGEYKLKGTLGPQFVGKSDPSFSFGTSARSKGNGQDDAPAPMLGVSSMGTQVEKRTAPAVTLSGRTKFGAAYREIIGAGPAAYKTVSSMGRQADSTRRSAPGGSFGMGRKGVVIETRHDTPGPGSYKLPGAVGRNLESNRKSGPSFSMRGREKFGSTVDTNEAAAAPGPGAYKPRIVNARHRKGPVHTIGGKNTFAERRAVTPGPGAYRAAGSMGRQLGSKKRSNPTFRFSMEARMPKDKIAGEGSGTYKIRGSVGFQPESTRRNQACFSFGSSRPGGAGRRVGWEEDDVPGPGHYAVPGAMGAQALSHSRSAAAPSLAGREKFGDPYGFVKTATGGQYALSSAVGHQSMSTKRSENSFSFGMGRRTDSDAATAAANMFPGPGAYQAAKSVGRQPLSTRRSAPEPSFRGREKFGDPYGPEQD